MKKFEIIYYHFHGQSYNRFYILANDSEDAKRIFNFYLHKDWIEEIYEYDEPNFYTEEEIKYIVGK